MERVEAQRILATQLQAFRVPGAHPGTIIVSVLAEDGAVLGSSRIEGALVENIGQHLQDLLSQQFPDGHSAVITIWPPQNVDMFIFEAWSGVQENVPCSILLAREGQPLAIIL